MLKDINGDPIPKTKNDEEITIDYLMELVSYTNSKEELKNTIGFARYNPISKSEHRFKNQLYRGMWYPIEKFYKKEHGVFNLVGYNNSHFGLFDKIVALPEHKDKFKSILSTDQRVKKYWKRKEREAIKLEEYHKKMNEKRNKEREEYQEIINEIGKPPQKITELNNYLKGKLKKSELFSLLMKDKELKEDLKKDVDYRIKKRKVLKSISRDKSYYYHFNNNFDKRYYSKMKNFKEVFESFDFSSESSLKNIIKEENKLEREKRFEEGKATILDILSKKTEEVSNKVFKVKKRKI